MSNRYPRQAIALTYDGAQAPTLSAKGNDDLADAIIAIAKAHEVPIYENAELVKMLGQLELGDSIPRELYLTIAEIIAFAWYLQGKVPVGVDINPPPRAERDVTPVGIPSSAQG